jgi:type IV pilus assembly protein PilV
MTITTMGRSEQGFTLIEVIVALTVLAIGIVSLSSVFPLAMRDVAESGSVTKAVQLCQQKIEDFQMLGFDSGELIQGYTHADSLNPIGGIYDRTWFVTDDQPISGCKLIEVTVTWQERQEQSISLSTVIAQSGR